MYMNVSRAYLEFVTLSSLSSLSLSLSLLLSLSLSLSSWIVVFGLKCRILLSPNSRWKLSSTCLDVRFSESSAINATLFFPRPVIVLVLWLVNNNAHLEGSMSAETINEDLFGYGCHSSHSSPVAVPMEQLSFWTSSTKCTYWTQQIGTWLTPLINSNLKQ